jgi:hypothetical protein
MQDANVAWNFIFATTILLKVPCTPWCQQLGRSWLVFVSVAVTKEALSL